MIDPACGSGHFLLGSFARLVDRWRKKEPARGPPRARAAGPRRVHGVDLNPYAVAIARFRLLLAAWKACGVTRLGDAPGFAITWPAATRCCTAASAVVISRRWAGLRWTTSTSPRIRSTGAAAAARHLSRRGRQPAVHHAQGPGLNAGVPGAVLHLPQEVLAGRAVPGADRFARVEGGFTGQITANCFMKREFGKKLIEEFFPEST